ncbi:unnamed protein product, partial [Phaeothamnion confervicola]
RYSVERSPDSWLVTAIDMQTVETVDDAVMLLEYAAAIRFDLHLKMHGALLLPPEGEGALLVLGHSGTGKSTLSAALFGRGWEVLGDDIAFVDGARAQACASPRRVALRHESRGILGETLWERVCGAPCSYVPPRGPLF